MYDLPPSQKSIFILSLSFFEEHFLFEVGLGEHFSMPTEIFASSVSKFGQLLPEKVDTRLWIFVFLSEFDFSFLTDDQKQRVPEFWKFVFQQLYDQGSRKGANWRSPMLILCESTICFWSGAQRTQQQDRPPCPGNVWLRTGIQWCQKNLPSSRSGVFRAVTSSLPSLRNTKSSAAAGRFAAAAAAVEA